MALLRVSTHSRPKAAGLDITGCHRIFISFNSQPPEGGWRCAYKNILFFISFNSQPPEGGWAAAGNRLAVCRCFNSQPPEGGWVAQLIGAQTPWQFQLTAARRRLGDDGPANSVCGQVSTHSRPKAAGAAGRLRSFDDGGFNSQPPEGGWWLKQLACVVRWCFNSQPPEGGWAHVEAALQGRSVSTHSRPKAAGLILLHACCFYSVSTHSRPKAAGMHLQLFCRYCRFQLTAARRRLA